jgi:crotonobetainyl-CoA:carnitine CoA-transferase CaiB-like acyl-CoA transferase
MEGWGLGYDAVTARNPRVIYASGSTYGSRGADASREGADLSGQAAGGLISTTGRPGQEPTPVGAALADHIGSQNLVSGILAALHARERTGRGQHVETSLLGGQIWAQASEYTSALLTGHPAGRADRGNPMIPGLYGIFPTEDGWIAIVGVVGAARATFYEVIGHAELSEQFPDLVYWAATKAKLFPILDTIFRTRPSREWAEILGRAGLRYAVVRDHADVIADPSVWENGYLARVAGPAGDEDVVATPVRFSATPAEPSVFAPELGQHTEEVLLEAGLTWEEIGALRDASAI